MKFGKMFRHKNNNKLLPAAVVFNQFQTLLIKISRGGGIVLSAVFFHFYQNWGNDEELGLKYQISYSSIAWVF